MNWTKYDTIRSKVSTGDIFFTASNALFSQAIRSVTRTTVSHVGFFVVIGSRVFTVECIEGSDCVMKLASVRFGNQKMLHIKTYSAISIDTILKDVGAVKYSLWSAILSPIYRTKSSEQYCAKWVAQKLKIKYPFLKRGIYPSDILTTYNQ